MAKPFDDYEDSYQTFCIYCQTEHGTFKNLKEHLQAEHMGTYAQINLAPTEGPPPFFRATPAMPDLCPVHQCEESACRGEHDGSLEDRLSIALVPFEGQQITPVLSAQISATIQAVTEGSEGPEGLQEPS